MTFDPQVSHRDDEFDAIHHHHAQHDPHSQKRLLWALLITGGFGLVELGGGLWANSLALILYAGWMILAYVVYRRKLRDMFVLAGGVLSFIVVISMFLAEWLLYSGDASGFLLIGLVVIGLSAAGGWWLKSVANEVNI